jgi:hypothetical protein
MAGNLISVPFQNNTNLNYGPKHGAQNILNIQRARREARTAQEQALYRSFGQVGHKQHEKAAKENDFVWITS